MTVSKVCARLKSGSPKVSEMFDGQFVEVAYFRARRRAAPHMVGQRAVVANVARRAAIGSCLFEQAQRKLGLAGSRPA